MGVAGLNSPGLEHRSVIIELPSGIIMRRLEGFVLLHLKEPIQDQRSLEYLLEVSNKNFPTIPLLVNVTHYLGDDVLLVSELLTLAKPLSLTKLAIVHEHRIAMLQLFLLTFYKKRKTNVKLFHQKQTAIEWVMS